MSKDSKDIGFTNVWVNFFMGGSCILLYFSFSYPLVKHNSHSVTMSPTTQTRTHRCITYVSLYPFLSDGHLILILLQGNWACSSTFRHIIWAKLSSVDPSLGSVRPILVTGWMARWWVRLLGGIYWVLDMFSSSSPISARVPEARSSSIIIQVE